MASNNFQRRPKTLIPKIILLIILGIFCLLHILLSYLDPGYCMHAFESFTLIGIL